MRFINRGIKDKVEIATKKTEGRLLSRSDPFKLSICMTVAGRRVKIITDEFPVEPSSGNFPSQASWDLLSLSSLGFLYSGCMFFSFLVYSHFAESSSNFLRKGHRRRIVSILALSENIFIIPSDLADNLAECRIPGSTACQSYCWEIWSLLWWPFSGMWPGLSSLSLEVFRNCVKPYVSFGELTPLSSPVYEHSIFPQLFLPLTSLSSTL